MPLKQIYSNLAQLTTKNAVGATLLMILALTAVSTSAAQLLVPEDYKPTTVLGLNKVETKDSNSSLESQANQTDGDAKEEQKEEEQNNTPIGDQDQKIILELERELGIQIPKVSKEQWNAPDIFTGYATNPQQKVIRLSIPGYSYKKKIKNEHLQLITKLTSLEWLWLSDTQITKIEGLENLTNLQKLSLGGQITKIEGLENLTNLQNLSLDRNQITKIEGLDNLTSLEWLWLGNTQITKIEGLDNLTSLQDLSLHNNKITKIEGLEKLTNLQKLSLDRNQISKIEGLDSLTSLRDLRLSENQITDATPLKALLLNQKKAGKKVLNISGAMYDNPLQTPPMEVVKEGSEAFLEWVEENR